MCRSTGLGKPMVCLYRPASSVSPAFCPPSAPFLLEAELHLPSALTKLRCVHILAWVFSSWTSKLLSALPPPSEAQPMGVTGTFSLHAEEEPSLVHPGEPSKQPSREWG